MSRVASPCVNTCRMNPATGWCEGCARTLDEIAAWSRMDAGAQRQVLAQLPARHRQAGGPAVNGGHPGDPTEATRS